MNTPQHFAVVPFPAHVRGLCRFARLEAEPVFTVYTTPGAGLAARFPLCFPREGAQPVTNDEIMHDEQRCSIRLDSFASRADAMAHAAAFAEGESVCVQTRIVQTGGKLDGCAVDPSSWHPAHT